MGDSFTPALSRPWKTWERLASGPDLPRLPLSIIECVH